jgi:hypothetical protein
MADMLRTLKFIYFVSQLCGISPYGSFLRNGGCEKPVHCRKKLFYSFILLIGISGVQFHYVIGIFMEITNISLGAYHVYFKIILFVVLCTFTTYLVTAITRLIGQSNFFKISRKLLSVGSFVNYREGTAFSNAVIALHFVLFVIYLFRFYIQWSHNISNAASMLFFISIAVSDTIACFAAFQFLYFVFTLRRQFALLSSSVNDVLMSTVKSDNIFSLKVRKVSDFSPEIYSFISALRDILYRHVMLCDVLELIGSSYSLQVLALIGSKFVYATLSLYLLFFSIFDCSLFPDISVPSLITLGSFEIIQLVTVLYCCKSACLQVGVIYIYCIKTHCVHGIRCSKRDFSECSLFLGYFTMSIVQYVCEYLGCLHSEGFCEM